MTMTIRKLLPLALAAALAACAGSQRPEPAPVKPDAVTLGDKPVHITSCTNNDGHVVFTGILTGQRRATRDWEVDVQVVSNGELIEQARAFPRDVPAGSSPVPVVGSGTRYVTGGGEITCGVLSANPLSRRPTPS